MKLYEYESKQVLEDYGLKVPGTGGEEFAVKAQVLQPDRKEKGGIIFVDSLEEARDEAERLEGSSIGGEKVETVLVEEKVGIEEEYYVSIAWDTDVRKPVLLFSGKGGSGVEDRDVESFELERDNEDNDFGEMLSGDLPEGFADTVERLFQVFMEEDLLVLEVNPLVFTGEELVAVDAVMEVDDDASFRHERDFPDRTVFDREKTEREKEAEKIDEDDHRGIGGKYVELDGDIAMVLAGGGASLTNMDALIEYGGRPANYTEYGGNPPEEKIYRLSKIILSKPGLKGCWHVGGTANNTDVYRTMKGFVRALREEEPEYPIVVRRDGPNADRAFELLREVRDELGLDMKLFRNDTPMTQTAEVLMDMVKEDE